MTPYEQFCEEAAQRILAQPPKHRDVSVRRMRGGPPLPFTRDVLAVIDKKLRERNAK